MILDHAKPEQVLVNAIRLTCRSFAYVPEEREITGLSRLEQEYVDQRNARKIIEELRRYSSNKISDFADTGFYSAFHRFDQSQRETLLAQNGVLPTRRNRGLLQEAARAINECRDACLRKTVNALHKNPNGTISVQLTASQALQALDKWNDDSIRRPDQVAQNEFCDKFFDKGVFQPNKQVVFTYDPLDSSLTAEKSRRVVAGYVICQSNLSVFENKDSALGLLKKATKH